MDEGVRAWESLYKMLPINHDHISTTPFVMPNSFLYNEERGFDGESMSDWFTGAGCVLIKLIVNGMLGIKPDLGGVRVRPASYMPFKSMSITVKLKGTDLTVIYENAGKGERSFEVNGNAANADGGVYIPDGSYDGKITVRITD